MNVYKTIFVRNEIISCHLVLESREDFSGDYYYEHERGHLIFALVKGESVSDAIAKSDVIVEEVTNKVSEAYYAN